VAANGQKRWYRTKRRDKCTIIHVPNKAPHYKKKYGGKEMEVHLSLISTLHRLKYQFLLTAALPIGKEPPEANRRLDEP
jgi:GTPase SAR1 family protein